MSEADATSFPNPTADAPAGPNIFVVPSGLTISFRVPVVEIRVADTTSSPQPTTAPSESTTPVSNPSVNDTTAPATTSPTNTTNPPRRVILNLPLVLFVTSVVEGATSSPNGTANPNANQPHAFPFPFPFFAPQNLEEVLNQSFMQYQNQRSGPAPATEQQIKQFVKEACVEATIEGDASLCTVCQCNFEKGEKMVTLPCTHTYHTECGVTWLKQHNSCPLCRAGLPSAA